MDSESAEGKAETPIYGDPHKRDLAEGSLSPLLLPQGSRGSELFPLQPSSQRWEEDRWLMALWMKRGTSFTYGGGTVLGILCSLIVQAMAVTQAVHFREGICRITHQFFTH